MPPLPAPPGPVLRHLTSLLTSGKSTFTPSRLTHLIPKPPKPNAAGTTASPGQFGNLFVTGKHKPDVMDQDLSEGEVGKKCLVAQNGANFRYVSSSTDVAPADIVA